MDIVLVHGAYHGSWCWDFVGPDLERLGHRVTTVDLPISDPSLGAADYAAIVRRAIPARSRPMIVGHSMAGLVLPLVAAERKVRRLVFLAAFMPLPGHSADDQRAAEPIESALMPTSPEFRDLGDDVWMIGPRTAIDLFYHDATQASARWAARRLRPQAYRVFSEVTPLTAWPDVEATTIVCRDDRVVDPDRARSVALDRIGVEALEIAGGHSPFLTRPTELARLLHSLA